MQIEAPWNAQKNNTLFFVWHTKSRCPKSENIASTANKFDLL